MVDCGNLRCYQERRSIRKELLSWSKKVPVVVGLETIAEHVGSRRRVRKLFEPFRCLESKEPVDWEPEENCIYCPDRVQLLIDAIEKSEKEAKEDNNGGKNTTEAVPLSQKVPSDNEGRDILKDLQTGGNELETTPPKQNSPKPESDVKMLSVNGDVPPKEDSNSEQSVTTAGKKVYTEDDLAAAINEVKNGKLGTRRAASLYGIPRSTLRNKVPRMDVDESSSGSHNVDDEDSSNDTSATSQKELPFQSVNDRVLQLQDLLQLSTMQYLAPITIPFLMKPDILATIDNLELEKKLQQIRHKHNLSKAPNNHYKEKARKYPLRPFQKDLIKKLTKERLELERRSAEGLKSDSFIDVKALTHSVILSALEGNSSSGSQHVKPHEPIVDIYSNALNHSALLSALTMKPMLSPHLAGIENPVTSHPNIVVPAYSPAKSLSSSSSTSSTLSNSQTGSTGSLQKQETPSSPGTSVTDEQKPSPSQVLFKYENTRIGDTLKDIIVKTISEKVKCKLESTDFSGLVGGSNTLGSQKAKETILSAFSIPETSSPPVKKIKREPVDPTMLLKNSSTGSSSNNGNSNSGTPMKKTRPKRGQYRKYNSQLLTEAVKAVQRGEMSVHRAGSYYGVPHSTLEYKVKERHLLRQKKIKEQQEKKLKEAEEAKKNEEKSALSPKVSKSDKVKTDASKLAAEILNMSPPKSFPGPSWLPPFTGPSPFESAAALGLFGSGFALSTPASELLRKLQHKVQSKSESDDSSLDSTTFPPSSSEGYIYIS